MRGIRPPRHRTRCIAGNLAKGQTGLSVAFDLPTQTGYDSDHVLARGEVGKVGVPISHLGDMRTLFDEIPLEQMNTSMTINATAPWLLSLYIAVAEEQGADMSRQAAGHGPERSDQGIPVARHLYLPAEAVAGDDRGRGGVLLHQCAEMEPDERVFLSPARSRARRRSRNWPLRWPPPSRFWTNCARAWRPRISRFWSGGFRSS
jgi:hypothetical protein